MARLENDARPQLSVLDRLFDDRPRESSEVPPNRFQAIRQYKDAVMRDLEWLLNTRANPEQAGNDFPQLRDSSYGYGLADFTAMSLGSADARNELANVIRHTIELHEPRLTNVNVEVPDPDQVSMQKMKMKFTVTALLDMAPAPEQISFDTELELSRGSYAVTGG